MIGQIYRPGLEQDGLKSSPWLVGLQNQPVHTSLELREKRQRRLLGQEEVSSPKEEHS